MFDWTQWWNFLSNHGCTSVYIGYYIYRILMYGYNYCSILAVHVEILVPGQHWAHLGFKERYKVISLGRAYQCCTSIWYRNDLGLLWMCVVGNWCVQYNSWLVHWLQGRCFCTPSSMFHRRATHVSLWSSLNMATASSPTTTNAPLINSHRLLRGQMD